MKSFATSIALTLAMPSSVAFAQSANSQAAMGSESAGQSSRSAPSGAQAFPASAVVNPKIIMLRWFVADVERAARFYQSVFGMTVLQQMGAKVRIMGFPGGSMPGLILIESADEARMNGSFIILVGNVQETLSRAAAAGGTLMNTKFAQKIDGVQASSSHFTDPDGNVVEVLQMPGAKP